jgi:hypothetical protein
MPTVKSKYDPKGRLTELVEKSKGFFVVKPATGFKSDKMTKKKAEELYEQQIACSQN